MSLTGLMSRVPTGPGRDRRGDPLLFHYEGITRYVPLLMCGGLFVVSVFLTVFGPMDWHISNPLSTYGFLIAYGVALTLGYLYATRRPKTSDTARRAPLDPSRVVVVGSLVFLLLFLPTVYTTTGKWYPDVWTGITDAGEAYAANKYFNTHGSQAALYVRMVLAPFTISIFPLTLFFFPRLTNLARGLGLLCVGLALSLSVAQGINRGVAEITGYTVLFFGLLGASSLRKGRRRQIVTAVVGIVVVCSLFFLYYGASIHSRVSVQMEGDRGRSAVNDRVVEFSTVGVGTLERDSVFFDVVPEPVESTGIIFNTYLTHGYKGLSLALEKEFEPTWGLGFSDFFRHNFLRLAGESELEDEVIDRTYAGQISDEGWPREVYWSTFFTHPASDISFPGVVVLMALIGYLFGSSWRETLTRGDPLACTVFFYLCILVFYLPANNQLFQGGELAIGVTVLSAAYLWMRRPASVAASRDAR